MADIGSIAAALTSVKTATEIAKVIQGSTTSLKEAEQKMKLAELVGALADAKIQIADIQVQMIEKDETIKNLKDKIILKGKMEYQPPYYWLLDAGKKDGPFCQKCYDADGKLIRLQNVNDGYWLCKVCNNGFEDPRHVGKGQHTSDAGYNPFEE